MKSSFRSLIPFLALIPLAVSANDNKWHFAGESQGISFQLQIRNQCKDGSKISIRLKSEIDRPVTVSFRLNDSDWHKTFSHKLKANAKDATLHFTPYESSACHPFIDQIYIESEESVVTQSESTSPSEE